MDRLRALLPRVAGPSLGLAKTIEQCVTDALRRVDRVLADLVDAEALDEVVGPLQVVRVLAVVLEEDLGRLERRLGRLDGDEQVRLANALPCRAADDHLPTA